MDNKKAIKQAVTQAVVEAAKAMMEKRWRWRKQNTQYP